MHVGVLLLRVVGPLWRVQPKKHEARRGVERDSSVERVPCAGDDTRAKMRRPV